MTTVASPNAFTSFFHSLRDLFSTDRGHATYVVGDNDAWVQQETVITVKMEKAETLEDFHVRLRRDYGVQKGDKIDILNNGGRVDTARLTLKPRA